MSNEVTIYTDGACSGNPGPGGYGAILTFGEHQKEINGGFRKTTNNRMELLAIIKALELLNKKCNVTIVSDSKYIVDAMTKKWVHKWANNQWKLRKNEDAKNPDLWKEMLEHETKHSLKFIWVKGHAGHAMNERADSLAVTARDNSAEHQADDFFENLNSN
jgi:ribonuclease HI